MISAAEFRDVVRVKFALVCEEKVSTWCSACVLSSIHVYINYYAYVYCYVMA
jgi:hypothetical protein